MRAHACIDLDALRHNLRVVRERAPGARAIAAVKADAYGHGATRVAAALDEADGFAVADIDEALQLRRAGIAAPIVLLSDPLAPETIRACAEQALEPMVFHRGQLAALETIRPRPLRVWVKIDTGMHRLGFAPSEAVEVYRRIDAISGVELAGWMTHLACADDTGSSATDRQVQRFRDALEGLPGERSIANSAGVCAWPETHADVVRPGIMLYGASPLLDRSADALGLQPAMTLSAPLISRSDLEAGEPVGYGATWRTPEPMPVGIVAIGYGDGYPRHAPSGTPVSVGGVRTQLIGRVSMDMIAVDLRPCAEAEVGDSAVLWGRGLPADEVAAAAGTIAYELFCRLTARVAFEYR